MIRVRSMRSYFGPNRIARESVLHCVLEQFDGTQPDLIPVLADEETERCRRLLEMTVGTQERVEIRFGANVCNLFQMLTRQVQLSCSERIDCDIRDSWIATNWDAVFRLTSNLTIERCIGIGLFILESGCSTESFDNLKDKLALRRLSLKEAVTRSSKPGDAAALERACAIRNIPWRRSGVLPKYYLLGEGRFQKRVNLTLTPRTSRIATDIARDKYLTNRLLRKFGLPVPRQVLVTDVDSAKAAADKMGYPVVVKPRRGKKGIGVTAGIVSKDELEVAFARAVEFEDEFLVESFIVGNDYRVLVADETIVAVSMRVAASVVGDGRHSILDLVRMWNDDLQKISRTVATRRPIDIDSDSMLLLGRIGLSLAAIPAKGTVVQLKSAGNWSAGGNTIDVTGKLHPENSEMVIRATRLVGLDIGGVDFITPDIGQSYRDVGGGICEINYRPGILNHMHAEDSTGRDIAGMVVDAIVPDGARCRMATVLVCGQGHSIELADLLARVFQRDLGWRVGLSNDSGVVLDRFKVCKKAISIRDAATYLVEDSTLDACIYSVAPETLLNEGLGLNRLDVAVIVLPPTAIAPNEDLLLIRNILGEAGARVIEAPIDVEETVRRVIDILKEAY